VGIGIKTNINIQEGEYSWIKPNSEAYLTIKKTKIGTYYVKGERYFDTNNPNGPRTHIIEVTKPLIVNQLWSQEYSMLITFLKDGTLKVEDEGYFSGYFKLK